MSRYSLPTSNLVVATDDIDTWRNGKGIRFSHWRGENIESQVVQVGRPGLQTIDQSPMHSMRNIKELSSLKNCREIVFAIVFGV